MTTCRNRPADYLASVVLNFDCASVAAGGLGHVEGEIRPLKDTGVGAGPAGNGPVVSPSTVKFSVVAVPSPIDRVRKPTAVTSKTAPRSMVMLRYRIPSVRRRLSPAGHAQHQPILGSPAEAITLARDL